MDEHTKAINALASSAGRAPRGVPHPMPASRDPVYDFEHLGSTLADSLIQAADDLMANAQTIAQAYRELAADIRGQVEQQSKAGVSINTRLKASGELVLEAQRRFNGS